MRKWMVKNSAAEHSSNAVIYQILKFLAWHGSEEHWKTAKWATYVTTNQPKTEQISQISVFLLLKIISADWKKVKTNLNWNKDENL